MSDQCWIKEDDNLKSCGMNNDDATDISATSI